MVLLIKANKILVMVETQQEKRKNVWASFVTVKLYTFLRHVNFGLVRFDGAEE